MYRSIPFVYPYGGTLTVQKPAVAVLSSGATSYPLNRPICALCTAGQVRLYMYNNCVSLHVCTVPITDDTVPLSCSLVN